jgi:AcrR family transcriptional regulator
MDRPVCTVKDMSAAKLEGTVRERLLAAATELFYAEGIHTVGVDRVIERAGVAKASLYATFGSKDELVRAYLQSRAEVRQHRILQRIARHDRPRERILAIFDLLGESVAAPSFRGCVFVNASAEGPRDDTPAAQVSSESRRWLRSLFVDLARAAGAADPDELGGQLVMLYDGATVGAAMDRDRKVAAQARRLAEALLSQACREPVIEEHQSVPRRKA